MNSPELSTKSYASLSNDFAVIEQIDRAMSLTDPTARHARGLAVRRFLAGLRRNV